MCLHVSNSATLAAHPQQPAGECWHCVCVNSNLCTTLCISSLLCLCGWLRDAHNNTCVLHTWCLDTEPWVLEENHHGGRSIGGFLVVNMMRTTVRCQLHAYVLQHFTCAYILYLCLCTCYLFWHWSCAMNIVVLRYTILIEYSWRHCALVHLLPLSHIAACGGVLANCTLQQFQQF